MGPGGYMTMNKERRKVDFEFRKNQALIAKYANDMSITVYIFQLDNPKNETILHHERQT